MNSFTPLYFRPFHAIKKQFFKNLNKTDELLFFKNAEVYFVFQNQENVSFNLDRERERERDKVFLEERKPEDKLVDWLIDFNSISTCLGLFLYIEVMESHSLYIHFACSCFLGFFFFCIKLFDVKYSYRTDLFDQ